MAEVLGAIASGVTMGALAGQIATSVLKLKSYLDEIKDAPENIRTLVDEIEDLQILLADIEYDEERNPYSEMLVQNNSASRCLKHCRRGVEKLARIVDDMDVDFERLGYMKRKLAGVKHVWKRDKVDKYRAELESAVRLLNLSHQVYTR